ncbi:MAG: hypothetical protein JJ901_03470 [Erythrobacter sp.]|uniref:hypothetical protein n=1 Tax=Erythrobacter sp. TaxID=1042 RepID=UPI001B20A972|nr:hypothetical protein [Erythrobacter sp.]MBO6767349.1 hypothetical protein [Erythrobacter sp.]
MGAPVRSGSSLNMSEPHSLVFHATVDTARLRSALKAPLMPATTFTDWTALGLGEAAPADLGSAMPATALSYLRVLRDFSLREYGWHFAFDPAAGTLTCVCLLWTDSPPEILAGLNTLRQLLAEAGTSHPGYIIVHGCVFSDLGTLGGVIVEEGHSRVWPGDHAQIAEALAHAEPIAQHLLDQANELYARDDREAASSTLLVDDLDAAAGD